MYVFILCTNDLNYSVVYGFRHENEMTVGEIGRVARFKYQQAAERYSTDVRYPNVHNFDVVTEL